MTAHRDDAAPVPPGIADAIVAWRAGDLETAATICRARTGADPLDADAWTILARLALQWRRPRQSLELCGRALVADPAHPEALVALGAVLGALAAFAEAETACRRSVQVRPESVEGWHQWSEVARLAGRHGMAVRMARHVVALRPEAPLAWNGLGTAQAAAGNLVEAGRAMARVCRLDPSDSAARGRLRQVLALHRARTDADQQTGRPGPSG